jgi:hypothetical protein
MSYHWVNEPVPGLAPSTLIALRAEALILVAATARITRGDHAESSRTEQVSQDSSVAPHRFQNIGKEIT